ncbi:MAG: hypothetical protein J7497_11885, partial [Chitinophagaceae bacterium]|nr:hypothetical protein [Chitinophagaceae bacterium]
MLRLCIFTGSTAKQDDEIDLDAAINNFSEDTLNRVGIARRIFQIIENSNNITLRIGIYGKWGSGKTSLMRLIKKNFGQNYVVGWFNPWVFDNQKDVWIGFRKAFEDALTNFNGGTLSSIAIRRAQYLILQIFRISAPKTTIGKLFDELVKNAGTPQQKEIKKAIKSYLDQTLPLNCKIVFFIDDLDRVD